MIMDLFSKSFCQSEFCQNCQISDRLLKESYAIISAVKEIHCIFCEVIVWKY